jgi:hypothetical protein
VEKHVDPDGTLRTDLNSLATDPTILDSPRGDLSSKEMLPEPVATKSEVAATDPDRVMPPAFIPPQIASPKPRPAFIPPGVREPVT